MPQRGWQARLDPVLKIDTEHLIPLFSSSIVEQLDSEVLLGRRYRFLKSVSVHVFNVFFVQKSVWFSVFQNIGLFDFSVLNDYSVGLYRKYLIFMIYDEL